ncbi:hypothetical protein I4F81_001777 [Pyropia yezoensis]|uniref:Uncharacterized protein n=1 Tax=Pyropia yezoensis TaxID=2788 RepID=A0ACC3BMM3_PYRYE|nr:hypothetical protein I4F81_001777 [Neopyropia yezoensis]
MEHKDGNDERAGGHKTRKAHLHLGIDLGTTFSVVAHRSLAKGSVARVVKDEQGNTVYTIKRLIGQPWSAPCVQRDVKTLRYTVKNLQDGKTTDAPFVHVDYQGKQCEFSSEQISGFIIDHLITMAEKQLNGEATSVIVTVPAHFNNDQREATKAAVRLGTRAHLITLLNEPTAAAIAMGYIDTAAVDEGQLAGSRHIVVVDFGGGTFDVTVIKIGKSETMSQPFVSVLATGGDPHLGGEDVDARIADKVRDKLLAARKGKALSVKLDARLRKACVEAKITLSTATRSDLSIPSGLGEDDEFEMEIRRPDLDQWCADLYTRAVDIIQKTMDEARVQDVRKNPQRRTSLKIGDIVLVGGSSRIPGFRRLLQERFPSAKISARLDADEAVALGAADHVWSLSGEGADSGLAGRLLLMDVTPLSLGVEVGYNHALERVIERNAALPATFTKAFTTQDRTPGRQKEIEFKVFEGDAAFSHDARLLGTFTIRNLVWPLDGLPNVRVTFEVDVSGVLNVTAKDMCADPAAPVVRLTIDNTLRKTDEEAMARMLAAADGFRVDAASRRNWENERDVLYEFCDAVVKRTDKADAAVTNSVSEDDKDSLSSLAEKCKEWIKDARPRTVSLEDMARRRAEVKEKFVELMGKANNLQAAATAATARGGAPVKRPRETSADKDVMNSGDEQASDGAGVKRPRETSADKDVTNSGDGVEDKGEAHGDK